MSDTVHCESMDIVKPVLKFQEMEVYQESIDSLCNEYIDNLPVPDMIYKSACFSGLMHNLYIKLLKPIIDCAKGTEGNNSNYNNYTLFDNIFDYIYIPICYRYNICPTIIQFCNLINIPSKLLTDVKNGVYRADGRKVSSLHYHLAQKWYQVCEGSIIGKIANENSIGGMFLAKSVFGYRDNTTLTIETTNNENLLTAEQIAEKHKTAEIPEKPELEFLE